MNEATDAKSLTHLGIRCLTLMVFPIFSVVDTTLIDNVDFVKSFEFWPFLLPDFLPFDCGCSLSLASVALLRMHFSVGSKKPV